MIERPFFKRVNELDPMIEKHDKGYLPTCIPARALGTVQQYRVSSSNSSYFPLTSASPTRSNIESPTLRDLVSTHCTRPQTLVKSATPISTPGFPYLGAPVTHGCMHTRQRDDIDLLLLTTLAGEVHLKVFRLAWSRSGLLLVNETYVVAVIDSGPPSLCVISRGPIERVTVVELTMKTAPAAVLTKLTMIHRRSKRI